MRGNMTIIGVVALAILLGAIYLFAPRKEVPPMVVEQNTATTTPSQPASEPDVLQLRAHIGERVSGLDIGITPIEVTEDSRCPMEVQCVWAGRVIVKTTLQSPSGEAPQLFELGKTVTTETRAITLIEVLPAKRVTAVVPQEYVFVFEVKKRTDK